MITHLRAKNFKSLVDVDLPLSRLNVLIGPNGSGKSNVLDALQLLRLGAAGLLAEALRAYGGVTALRSSVAGRTQDSTAVHVGVDVPLRYGDASLSYDLSLNALGPLVDYVKEEVLTRKPNIPGGSEDLLRRDVEKARFRNVRAKSDDVVSVQNAVELAITQIQQSNFYPEATELRLVLSDIQHYSALGTVQQRPVRLPQVSATEAIVREDGSNLTTALAILMGDDDFNESFQTLVRRVFPDFKRLHFPPITEGKVTLQWYTTTLGRPLNAWELSDGMIAYFSLLCVLLNPKPPSLICIDEPEVGLHPRMLGIIADLLQAASEKTQVIVTTHSPELVNYCRPEDVLIVEAADGATTVRRPDPKELAAWLEDYSLGELLRLGHLEET